MGLKFAAPTVFDKDNVAIPEAGEIIYDSSVSKFYGHDHSSNWVELSSGGSSMPAGVIIPFGGTTAPNGYLFADGSAVSRTVYADLFAAIGTAFGAGDGATTFNLPDLRGRFMRGVSDSSGVDADSASRTASASGGNTGNNVGSLQSDATKKNGLALSDPGHAHTYGDYYAGSGAGGVWPAGGGTSGGTHNRGTSSNSTNITLGNGDSETRPKNLYVNYIVKF